MRNDWLAFSQEDYQKTNLLYHIFFITQNNLVAQLIFKPQSVLVLLKFIQPYNHLAYQV
jgi:hypothetical protein